jgi:hypothetical protein
LPSIDKPGVYTIAQRDYHADPAPEPSLSASLSTILLTRSPMHAQEAHPRLNPAWQEEESSSAQDEGTALHSLILENRSVVEVLRFDSYRTNEAKAAKAKALAAGKIPLLMHRFEELTGIPEAVRAQLDGHLDAADCFTKGAPERMLLWREETPFGGIWCRSLVDWLPDDPDGFLDDLKSVGQTARPDEWSRNALKEGRALQAAFNLRGARRLGRRPAGFRFVLVERNAPYAVAVARCEEAMMEAAEKQVTAAIHLFARCLHSGSWPGYFNRTWFMEPKPWALVEVEAQVAQAEQYLEGAPRRADGWKASDDDLAALDAVTAARRSPEAEHQARLEAAEAEDF